MTPAIATLIEFVDEKRVDRILWIDQQRRFVWTIDSESPDAFPVCHDGAEFFRALEEDRARKVSDDKWRAPLNDEQIPARQRKKRDDAWALMHPLLLKQPDIFDRRRRGRLITEFIRTTKAQKQKIYHYLRRYWQRGMTPNALLPDFKKCGGPGKAKAVSDAQRGRPRLSGSAGMNVTDEVRRLICQTVAKYFATNEKLDFSAAYDQMIKEHFSEYVLDEELGHQRLRPKDRYPSLAQFRYWSEKEMDFFKIARRRRTSRVYDLDSRALLGSSTAEAIGPGSRFQIDATIADFYLVSRYDRTKIVGRPVIYLIIDVFSRMIVGLYVGFEGPSWVGAVMAIANSVRDKVEFCADYEIKIGAADWPCNVLSDVLLGDRGELASVAVDTLTNNFGVHIENAGPYRADWKGIVEQRFRLLPAKISPDVPGYVLPGYQRRGVQDYRLDAALDIHSFTQIIIYYVLFHNNYHGLQDYPRDAQMIKDGVKPVPVDLWEWGVVHRSGRLRECNYELLKLSLLPADAATVTASGIRFQGLFYSCAKAIKEHWFERARQRRSWKVQISYDPRLMDTIYLHGEGSGPSFIPCELTEKCADARGRTLWEIVLLRAVAKAQLREHEPRELEGKINLLSKIDEIVDSAEKAKDRSSARPQSKRARVRKIRENQAEERRRNQSDEAFSSKISDEIPTEGEVIPFSRRGAKSKYALPDTTELRGSKTKRPKDPKE